MNHRILTGMMNEAWTALQQSLEGLSDHEFFWEPVPACWRIRQTDHGTWTYDYAIPPPAPAPVTTIGWRLVHLAACKIVYYDHAFGPATQTFADLTIPHTATTAVAWLDAGHTMLASALAQHAAAPLDAPVHTNWGERLPTWQLFWMLMRHDLQHGAEIGCLRDLYRHQHARP
jgi:hypothetical protein